MYAGHRAACHLPMMFVDKTKVAVCQVQTFKNLFKDLSINDEPLCTLLVWQSVMCSILVLLQGLISQFISSNSLHYIKSFPVHWEQGARNLASCLVASLILRSLLTSLRALSTLRPRDVSPFSITAVLKGSANRKATSEISIQTRKKVVKTLWTPYS